MLVLGGRKDTGTVKDESRLVRELLGLDPQAKEFSVVFGVMPGSDREVAMLTRSMLEIMIELGAGIELPEKDLQEARVLVAPSVDRPGEEIGLPVRIHSGAKPSDAYAAVRYRDTWFWIDDRDVPSKRTFTFLMILFSLAEAGQSPTAPLVTVPAGR